VVNNVSHCNVKEEKNGTGADAGKDVKSDFHVSLLLLVRGL
jgi:hypothetical protein